MTRSRRPTPEETSTDPCDRRSSPPRTYATLGQETAITLLRAADQVRQTFLEVLRPHRLSLQQYNVLRILRAAGEAGLPAMQVSERLIERTPGITRLIDGLERRRLVERQRCSVDRRVVHNRITADGLELMAELDPIVDQADEDAVAVLGEAGQERLLVQLRKLLQEE